MKTAIHRIWPIALIVLPLLLAAGAVTAQEPEKKPEPKYMGVKACKLCHSKRSTGAQFKVWSKEDHSKAFERLKSDEAKTVAEKAGIEKPPHEAPECVKCHVTAFGLDKERFTDSYDKEEGVTCEACHGPGEHFSEPEDGHHTAEGKVDPTAELCKGCHNPESPTWDPERYTLESGEKVGFDFKLAYAKIAHPRPEEGEEEEKE